MNNSVGRVRMCHSNFCSYVCIYWIVTLAKWYYIAQYYCNVSYSIQQNNRKRLIWSKEQFRTKEEFKDIIFTDDHECSWNNTARFVCGSGYSQGS